MRTLYIGGMEGERFVSQIRFAELAGVSAMAISKGGKSGLVFKGEDGRYDLLHPVNNEYLFKKNPKRKGRVAPEPKKKQKADKEQPAIEEKAKPVVQDMDPEELEAMTGSLYNLDKLTVDKLKVIEAIHGQRLKNDESRGVLIDRRLVRRVFGKIHTVDVQEFLAIPISFAPYVAGLFGKDDPETIMLIEKELSAELYKCLNHVKRIIDDFMKSERDGEILDAEEE